jgi:hypothetical protein
MDAAPFCTLPADALAQRVAWIRAEVLPHARHVERLDAGVAWELDDAPGLTEKLDRLIALERECCATLVFARAASTSPGRIRLEIRGEGTEAEIFRTLLPAP